MFEIDLTDFERETLRVISQISSGVLESVWREGPARTRALQKLVHEGLLERREKPAADTGEYQVTLYATAAGRAFLRNRVK